MTLKVNQLKIFVLMLTVGSAHALSAEIPRDAGRRVRRVYSPLSVPVDSLCAARGSQTPSGEIAKSVASFGGAFINEGVLNIYMADLADTVVAKDVIQEQLVRQHRPNLPVRFIKGKFSYCELYRYMDKIGRVDHWSDGVSMTWVDERNNRLVIGVVNEDARVRIRSIIDKEQIPRDAVSVQLIPYATVTLQHSDHCYPTHAEADERFIVARS